MSKLVNTSAKLVEEAKKLGKHESELVSGKNGKKHVLCGTCLAYEDEVWNGANGVVLDIIRLFGLDRNDSLITDLSSELRDKALELVLKANNADLVIGRTEF